MIGETGERKSAVATPDGKSRKKKKKNYFHTLKNIVTRFKTISVSLTNIYTWPVIS